MRNLSNNCNIKAIGWVGKDNEDGACKIISYYPSYEQTKKNALHKKSKLYDYLRRYDGLSVKMYTDHFFSALAFILELSGINYNYNEKSVRYTKTRLQSYLKDKFPEEYEILRSNISKWAINTLNSQSIIDKDVYSQVKTYINHDFLNLFKFDITAAKYLEFIADPEDDLYREITDEEVKQNVFIHNDVEVEIATVHSVKGETHVATLYMETSFKGKCESQRIGEQLCGIPYTGTSVDTKMSLRIAYVAMSRPRYMLCMAVKKENYNQLDSIRLSNLWEIIEI